MSLSTMRKRRNATAFAAIGLLASTINAAPTAPTLSTTYAAAPTDTSNDLAPTTLSTTHAPAFPGTDPKFRVCDDLDEYNHLQPFPCGPWLHQEEFTELRDCLKDPKDCNGSAEQMLQIYEACANYAEYPACPKPNRHTHGDGNLAIRGDNPFGDLLSRFRCLVDHTFPECKALGINAVGYVVPEKMEVGGPEKSAVETAKAGEEHHVDIHKRTSIRGLFCLDPRM